MLKGKGMRRIFVSDKIFDNEKKNFFKGFIIVDDGIIKDVVKKQFVGKEYKMGEICDYTGNMIIPGFVDAHTHLLKTEVRNHRINLKNIKTKDDMFSKLSSSKKEIIIAENFDESKIREKSFPTIEELDKISKKRPIIIRRICGHIAFINKKAIEILSDYFYSIDPKGILIEKQVFALDEIFMEDDKVLIRRLDKGIKNALELGITSIGEIAGMNDFKIYQRLKLKKGLKIRISLYMLEKHYKKMNNSGLMGGFGDEYLSIQGIKYFMDGSIGGYTAAISFPYKYNDTKGIILQRNFKEKIKSPINNNYQILTHAIGDRAIQNAINTYSNYKVADYILRIEHSEILNNNMIYRISKMPIVLVMQPNFVRNWDYDDNDMYERNLGEYAGLNNRYKDILNAGINLAFSSDSMPMSPLYGIGKITNYKRESQRISFEQAIDCYTRIAAKAIRRNDIGIIQNGKKADFAIINNNKENIEATIVNGITVFSKE